jgi:hypothetical protein
MPKFSYSSHARRRMNQRRVSRPEVEQCVLRASSTFQTRGKNRYRAEVGGRNLQVVVAADRDNDIEKFIVTVIDEDVEDAYDS